jgi:hypothetical protein
MKIESNHCKFSNGPASEKLNIGQANGTISVTANRGSGSSSDECILVFRWADENNFWMLDYNKALNNVKLTKKVAGTNTDVATSGAVTMNTNTDYTMSVVLSGSSITGKFTGMTDLTATDSWNSTATYAGLALFSTATVYFDDFTVTN